jgi:transposase
MAHPYRSHILDHLGLVAGMFDELGIGDVIDQATQQHPDMRIVTAGHAVNAMVLNGLGFVNQQRYLGPRFFQDKPTSRLFTPAWSEAKPLNDDARGRALDTLDDDGVTALSSLMAATAAERLGLAPTVAHLESPSFHVDGRDNHDEPPDEQVVPITRGDRRDHRPDLNQVRLELMVEHQAGIPVLMQPLSGTRSDAKGCGQGVREHIDPLHTTYGTTYVVADSALYSAENLQPLAHTQLKWLTRVPATLSEAQSVLAQAEPQARMPLTPGYRSHGVTSTYGGIAPRWVLIDAESRQPQAKRTVAQHLRKQRAQEVKAFKKLCAKACACEADARQALATVAQGLQATGLHALTSCPTRRYGTRGRPGQGAQPDHVVYQIIGALASRVAAQQARVEQQSCFILATNDLDHTQLPPQERFAGDKGQVYAERGFRFLKDPCFLASSLSLKKPERIMALFMVMTVCLLVYAALE